MFLSEAEHSAFTLIQSEPPERVCGVSKMASCLCALRGTGAADPGQEKGQCDDGWDDEIQNVRRKCLEGPGGAGWEGGAGVLFTSRHASGLQVR